MDSDSDDGYQERAGEDIDFDRLENPPDFFSATQTFPSGADDVLCGECEEQKASLQCTTCGVSYCESCSSQRHRKAAFAHHVVTPLEKAIRTRQKLCSQHEGERLNLFCDTDLQVVCAHCLLVGSHQEHKRKPLKEAHAQRQEELKSLLLPVLDRRQIVEKMLQELEAIRKEVSIRAAAMRKDVVEQVDGLLKMLQMRKQAALAAVAAVEDNKISRLADQIRCLESEKSELDARDRSAQSLLHETDSFEFLSSFAATKSLLAAAAARPMMRKPNVTPDLGLCFSCEEARSAVAGIAVEDAHQARAKQEHRDKDGKPTGGSPADDQAAELSSRRRVEKAATLSKIKALESENQNLRQSLADGEKIRRLSFSPSPPAAQSSSLTATLPSLDDLYNALPGTYASSGRSDRYATLSVTVDSKRRVLCSSYQGVEQYDPAPHASLCFRSSVGTDWDKSKVLVFSPDHTLYILTEALNTSTGMERAWDRFAKRGAASYSDSDAAHPHPLPFPAPTDPSMTPTPPSMAAYGTSLTFGPTPIGHSLSGVGVTTSGAGSPLLGLGSPLGPSRGPLTSSVAPTPTHTTPVRTSLDWPVSSH